MSATRMSEEEFEAVVGRIERDYEERGADLTDVYLIVNWSRDAFTLLRGAAAMLKEITDQGFLPSERDVEGRYSDSEDDF